MSSLFNETAQQVAQQKDEASLLLAQMQARKIEAILQQLADACECLVMNSAAIAKRPSRNRNKPAVHDMTEWARQQLNGK